MMKPWLKEPLLHFLVAGALLFAAYGWLNRGNDSSPNEVRITTAEVTWLKETWARQWQRPPSEQELRGLVTDYLKETLLAHEARALGLDENDTVVRRRLAQKMEFMVNDTAQLAEPREDALRRVYEAHRERFQAPARISFSHVYFSRDRRGARAEADVLAALRQLSRATAPANASDLGDSFIAQYDFEAADEPTVASQLGPEFARRVFTLEAGTWQGPVESGYGLHIVRVTNRQAAQPRDFAEVRGEVLALWRQQHEAQWREQYFAGLLKKYDVVADDSVKPLIGPLALAQERAK